MEVESEYNFTTEYFDGRYVSGYPDDYSYHGNITVACSVPESGRVYAYSEVAYMRSLEVFYGESSMSISNTEPFVADLGLLEKGERVAISAEVNYMTDGPMTCAMLNHDKFQQAISILKERSFKEEYVNDDRIKGTVSAQKPQILVFSIPYDEGWTVLMDGKEVDVNALGEALISVVVPAGEHTIELKFKTVGLTTGIIISLVCLALLILLCLQKKLWPYVYRLLPGKIKAIVLEKSGFKITESVKKEPVFNQDELEILDELTNSVKEND